MHFQTFWIDGAFMRQTDSPSLIWAVEPCDRSSFAWTHSDGKPFCLACSTTLPFYVFIYLFKYLLNFFFCRWTPKAKRTKPKYAAATGVSSIWCPSLCTHTNLLPISSPASTLSSHSLSSMPLSSIQLKYQFNSFTSELSALIFHLFSMKSRACQQSQCIIQRGITSLNCNIGSNELRSASELGASSIWGGILLFKCLESCRD